mgnify:CR=1 FL=1
MKLDIEPLNDRNLMKQLQQLANKSVVSVLLLPEAGVNRVLSAASECDSDLNFEIINKLIQRNAAKQAASLCINPVCFYSLIHYSELFAIAAYSATQMSPSTILKSFYGTDSSCIGKICPRYSS